MIFSKNKKPPSEPTSRSPSLSSASNEESEDQLSTPINKLQLDEPEPSTRPPEDKEANQALEPTLETEKDEDWPLNFLIQRNLDALSKLGPGGTSLVEMERAVALSLLEGRATPIDGLGFDPDDFDEEQDRGYEGKHS